MNGTKELVKTQTNSRLAVDENGNPVED